MSRRQLRTYLERDHSYRVYIGYPLDAPRRWMRIVRLDGDHLLLDDEQQVPVEHVGSFIVAYDNGEILDFEKLFPPLPEDVHSIDYAEVQVKHVLKPALLDSANGLAVVEYGPPRKGPDGRWHYSTALRNVGSEPLRVIKFGGYARRWWRWRLSTINGAFFYAEEFRSWYGMGEREWLEPGEQAEDPDNYGPPPVIWAYFCTTKSGIQFVAGKILAAPETHT